METRWNRTPSRDYIEGQVEASVYANLGVALRIFLQLRPAEALRFHQRGEKTQTRKSAHAGRFDVCLADTFFEPLVLEVMGIPYQSCLREPWVGTSTKGRCDGRRLLS